MFESQIQSLNFRASEIAKLPDKSQNVQRVFSSSEELLLRAERPEFETSKEITILFWTAPETPESLQS